MNAAPFAAHWFQWSASRSPAEKCHSVSLRPQRKNNWMSWAFTGDFSEWLSNQCPLFYLHELAIGFFMLLSRFVQLHLQAAYSLLQVITVTTEQHLNILIHCVVIHLSNSTHINLSTIYRCMTTNSPPGWKWRLHFMSRSPCQPAAHSGCRSSTRCPSVSWAPGCSRHRCEGLPEAAEDVSLNLSPVHTKDFYQTYLLKLVPNLFFPWSPPCACPRQARPPPLSRCSGCEGHTVSFTTSLPLSRQTIASLQGPLAPPCGESLF